MLGQAHDSGCVKRHIFRQHSVDIAAQSRFLFGGGGRTVDPSLHEDSGDPVSGLEIGDTVASLDDLSRAVGAGNSRQGHLRVIEAFDHHEVAVVQRGGMHLDDNLAGKRFWDWRLERLKVVNAKR